MRKGLLIVGIIILVIGGIIAGLALVTDHQSVTIPPGGASGSAEVLTVSYLGSGTTTISWSGGAASTAVTVYSCSDSSCGTVASASAPTVASGTGGSGSLSFSSSGTSYFAITESGSAGGLTSTVQLSGLTVLLLIGIIIVILGVVFAVLGWRLAPKVVPMVDLSASPAPAATGDAPASDTYGTAQPSPSVGAYTPPPSVYHLPPQAAEAAEDSTPPVSTAPTRMTTPPPTAPGGRPPVQCKSCGTWNEAWITNCRWCKRTLSSTGGG